MRVSVLVLVLVLGACAASPPPAAPRPDPLATVPKQRLLRDGLAFAARGDDIRAEQYLSAAITRGAPAERVLPALVRVCVRSSRYGTALLHVRRALARQHVAPGLRLLAASLFLAADQDERGRAELERVVDEEPELALAHFALGSLLAEAGEAAPARHHLDTYLDLAAAGPHASDAERLLRRLERPRRRARAGR